MPEKKFGNVLLSVLFTGARLALGILLVVASQTKMRHPFDFLKAVYGYEVLSFDAAAAVAAVLPVTEFLVGTCLVLGFLRRGASAVAVGLFLIFLAAVSSALYRELEIECGCIGPLLDGQRIGITTLLRLLFLLLVAGGLLWWETTARND